MGLNVGMLGFNQPTEKYELLEEDSDSEKGYGLMNDFFLDTVHPPILGNKSTVALLFLVLGLSAF